VILDPAYKEPGSYHVMPSKELLEYNPWWKKESEIDNDPEIQKWEASNLKWDPRLRHTFKHEDLIYSLRGPRQVGKTTLVKLMIRDFLGSNISKWNIMYYSFEVEDSPRDVVNIIDEYLSISKRFRKNSRSYIFLDEISYVNNWQKGIKKLWDMGKLKNCTVIATGSHSIDLRHATEKLPGRRGKTNDTLDKIMPTMKFSEYVESIDKDLNKEIESRFMRSNKHRFDIIDKLLEGKIPDKFAELAVYQKELDTHLSNYLMTGGIAPAIDEFLQDGSISEGTYKTYLDAMTGDLNKANRGDSYLRQLMPNIISSMGNPVSWQTLKRNSDIGSHHTVEQYVQTLSEMFVLYFFYKYDADKSSANFGSDKKIYFHDPFFFHALHGWIAQKDPFDLSQKYLSDPENFSHLLECVVGDHMIRLAFGLTARKLTFDYPNSIFYWRGKNDREVDFIIKSDDKIIPIELKYQNSIKKEDQYGLIDFKKASKVKHSLLLTKDKLAVSTESVLIPTSLFLLLV